jgi:preprotein translocase subunit YajC
MGQKEPKMKSNSLGNLILAALICVVIFIVFMAVRPARAQSQQLRFPVGE